MELKTLRVEQHGAVATIWIHRPHRNNAWTGTMHGEFRAVMDELDNDDTVRVVVITGDGRMFCPGADGAALASHVERGGYDPGTPDDLVDPAYGVRPQFAADFAWMLGLRVVTIAAMNGAAAGAGLVLACYCDLRFAAAGAKFTTAHGKLNYPAEYGLSWLLPRLVGLTHANDLLLSSRVFLAEEAEAMGMVNQVLPANEVYPAAMAYAEQLVTQVSPASLATTKRQIAVDLLHNDPAHAVRQAQALIELMATQPDFVEAMRVFMREPDAEWSQPPQAFEPPGRPL